MLIYCDYISDIIRRALITNDSMRLLEKIGGITFDLYEDGSFKSTTKVIELNDKFKTSYRITIESIPEPKKQIEESVQEIEKQVKPKRSKKDGDNQSL